MKQIAFVTSIALVCAAPVLASCPASPDHQDQISGLIGSLQSASNESDARDVNASLWALWTDAPDEIAQGMLDSGMNKRRVFDFVGALDDLDRLVAYCPTYAEGYNQRAFVHFLRQDFAPALEDLDVTLRLSPQHIGALSGRALTLLGLGRTSEAREDLLAALKLNPWLSERALLQEGAPLGPQGQKL